MSRYKGSFKETARLYPHVVEVIVPPSGFGRRIDDMHALHRQRGIRDQQLLRDDEHDYIRWCFADREIADAFVAEFSGALLPAQRGANASAQYPAKQAD
jgi:hypothetical protein